MDVADLFVALTISNQPVAGSIIVSERRVKESVFCLVSLLQIDTPDTHKP
jgi:hypothetical protein